MDEIRKTGRVTIPTDLDVVPETLEILKKWGADAIRDCDGTDFPQQLKDADAKIYSTYYTTRKDNDNLPKSPPLQDSIQLIAYMDFPSRHIHRYPSPFQFRFARSLCGNFICPTHRQHNFRKQRSGSRRFVCKFCGQRDG